MRETGEGNERMKSTGEGKDGRVQGEKVKGEKSLRPSWLEVAWWDSCTGLEA